MASQKVLTQKLRKEYEDLFNTCIIKPEKQSLVEKTINYLVANKEKYRSVGEPLGIPWYFIAVIHSMESSMSFKCHLHNGDPLSARTVQEPADRPKNGNPPFTWEQSAADAMIYKHFDSKPDWSLSAILFRSEAYNGWGYRSKSVNSAYLWSFSNHYSKGKYIADHTWSATAVSDQCGAAVLLRRMAEKGMIEFADQPAPKDDTPPLVVTYSMTLSSDPKIVEQVETLQRWLNTFEGIFVKVDGVPGKKTSDAYKSVTGNYLPGDPR